MLWEAEIAGDWVFMGPDGRFVSVIREIGDLYFFRPEENIPLWHFKAQENFDHAIMSDNDNTLLVGTDRLYLFNKTDNVPVYSAPGFFSMATMSPDGRYFSGVKDDNLFVFHADLVSPENSNDARASAVSEGSVALRWFEDPSAGSYALQVSQSQPFENENIEVGDNYAIMDLAEGTYYWRVNPIAPDGTEGDWSEVQTLVVEPPERFPWTVV